MTIMNRKPYAILPHTTSIIIIIITDYFLYPIFWCHVFTEQCKKTGESWNKWLIGLQRLIYWESKPTLGWIEQAILLLHFGLVGVFQLDLKVYQPKNINLTNGTYRKESRKLPHKRARKVKVGGLVGSYKEHSQRSKWQQCSALPQHKAGCFP